MSGIPKSQEIKRVVDNVARIQEKAKENTKSNEGSGGADSRPESLTPTNAGRRGAFRKAKRKSGIPVTNYPKKVTPARDRSGKRILGRDYDFGNGKVIREHSGGHKFPDNPSQNRGAHFNDIFGNHYDF